jgi:hypothetical protein
MRHPVAARYHPDMRALTLLLLCTGVASADKGDGRRVTGIAAKSYAVSTGETCTFDNVCKPGRATSTTLPPSTISNAKVGDWSVSITARDFTGPAPDPRVPVDKRCGIHRARTRELVATAERGRDFKVFVLAPGAHVDRIHNAYFVGTTVVVEYSTEMNEPIAPPVTSCGRTERIAAFDLAPHVR